MSRIEPILSSADIAALLDTREATPAARVGLAPETIDILATDRFIRHLVPTLNVGFARTASGLLKTLTSMLYKRVEVHNEDPEVISGRGLASALKQACCIAVLKIKSENEPESLGLLALDRPLTFKIIERLFGGNGEPVEGSSSDRPLTNLERRMLLRALGPIMREINRGIEPNDFFKFELDRIESGLDMVPGFTPDMSVLFVPFTMTIGDQLASLSLVMTSTTLEPLRNELFNTGDPEGKGGVLDLMDSVPVTLSVELGTTAMSVRDVLALQPGQVLKLSRHRTEELPVKVEGVPKFFGMPVHEDGAIGIEITRKR